MIISHQLTKLEIKIPESDPYTDPQPWRLGLILEILLMIGLLSNLDVYVCFFPYM